MRLTPTCIVCGVNMLFGGGTIARVYLYCVGHNRYIDTIISALHIVTLMDIVATDGDIGMTYGQQGGGILVH